MTSLSLNKDKEENYNDQNESNNSINDEYVNKLLNKLEISQSDEDLSGLSRYKDEVKYFKKKEQINEVKYYFFMILYNSCSYDNEFINSNVFIKNSNDIFIRRIIIQEIQYQDKKINYGQKNYIFYPNSSNNEFIFIYDKNEFKIHFDKKCSIEYSENDNKNEKEKFNKKLSEGVNYKSGQSWINDIIEKDKSNLDLKNKKSKKNDVNPIDNMNREFEVNKNEQEKNNMNNNYSLIDNESENETKSGKIFYKEDGNKLIKFIVMPGYKKEVDGYFTKNREIKLKKFDKIALQNFTNMSYDIDNDLKSMIIYKNFKSDTIKENTPMIIEVKKSFELLELLIQIKQDAKIMKGLELEDKNIKLPKLIIGILCNYNELGVNKEFEKLSKKYKDKDETILTHIIRIIEETKLNVIIGAIKDGTIDGYSLNEEDYEKNNLLKRVDLPLMNKIICKSTKLPGEINDIIKKYGDNYKSLNATYKILIDTSQLSSSYEEKKLKIAEENEKLKKEMKETEEKHLKEMKETEEKHLKEMKEMKETEEKYLKEIKEKDDLIESLKKQLEKLNKK